MSIDAIVARAQQVVAESMKEAYSAGRADAAGALKSKVLELFEELLGPSPAPAAELPAHEAPVVHFSSEPAAHDPHAGQNFEQGQDHHQGSGNNEYHQPQHDQNQHDHNQHG